MKKFFLLTILTFFSLFIFGQGKSGKLIILHTNDLHSNVTGFSPESEYTPCSVNDDSTIAGFSRIAGIINEERAKNEKNVLLLDAGDFLMGSLFHTIEAETGFQLNLMSEMGYDVVNFGNHEFDYGPETFAKIVNTALSNGKIPLLTLSNVKFNSKSSEDDSFEDLYKNNIIKPYHIIEKNGFRIGVFGILGKSAESVAPNAKPLEFTDKIKISKKIVKELRDKEKVDLVICLSHSGIYKDKKGRWTGEDVKLAEKVKGIDIIIGGHTHTKLTEPVWINDIPILQTGSQGKNIGRFEININNGKISSAKYQLLSVDDKIMGDCLINEKIEAQIEKIDSLVLNPLGLSYYKPLAETSYELVYDRHGNQNENNLGTLIADAIYYYTNEFSQINTDLSLVAAGLIRDNIRVGKNGVQSVPDIFRVVSLGEGEDGIPGYPLSQVYLKASELKKVLELLLAASARIPTAQCFYSGMTVYYNSSKGFLKKIKRIEIGDQEINISKKNKKLYGITVNSNILEFIPLIKKISLGMINIKPKDINGDNFKELKDAYIDFDPEKEGIQEGKEWIAVIKYLETFQDINGNNIPDFPDKYSKPILRIIDINSK